MTQEQYTTKHRYEHRRKIRTDEQIAFIENRINNLPRKIFIYHSADFIFNSVLFHIAIQKIFGRTRPAQPERKATTKPLSHDSGFWLMGSGCLLYRTIVDTGALPLCKPKAPVKPSPVAV